MGFIRGSDRPALLVGVISFLCPQHVDRMYSYDRRTAAEPELQEALRDLEELRELDQNLDHIESAFELHFHLASRDARLIIHRGEPSWVMPETRTGALLDPTVKTQLDVLKKAMEGLKAAEEVAKSTGRILELYPEDKTALRAKKDADTMVERFQKHAEAARKIVRTISSKAMPPALKKLGEAAGKIIADRLVDPSKLQVVPWMSETWEKNVLYQMLLRIKSPELKDYVFSDKVDVTIVVDSGSLEGPRLSNEGSPLKGELSPRTLAERMFGQLKGWPGLKGETEATESRKKHVSTIADVMKSTARQLGTDSGNPEISRDLRTITMDYRSHLPKEGASEVGESLYYDMVREEIKRAKGAFERNLAPWKDQIESLSYSDGEKGWIYTTATLK